MKTPVSPGLLDKYLNGTCTPKEREEVENWYQSFESSPEINTLFPESKSEEYSKSVLEKIKNKIKLRDLEDKKSGKFQIGKQAYWYLAASILISTGVWTFSL